MGEGGSRTRESFWVDGLYLDENGYYGFDGEMDSETFSKAGCNIGRNDMPALLFDLVHCGALDIEKYPNVVIEAWVMAEFPERKLGRQQWVEWFRKLGYTVNGEPAEPPEQVTLYRGDADPSRMAWTSNRFVAEWFRDRWPNGKLWTVTIQADRLLAHCNNVRLDESGQSEDEYVIDPTGIEPQEVEPCR